MKSWQEDTSAWVDEPHRSKKVRTTGLLAVQRDGTGQPATATLIDPDGAIHHVVLDAKGSELAAQLEGRRVVVNGHAAFEDGESFLTVRKFREARHGAPLETD